MVRERNGMKFVTSGLLRNTYRWYIGGTIYLVLNIILGSFWCICKTCMGYPCASSVTRVHLFEFMSAHQPFCINGQWRKICMRTTLAELNMQFGAYSNNVRISSISWLVLPMAFMDTNAGLVPWLAKIWLQNGLFWAAKWSSLKGGCIMAANWLFPYHLEQ